MTNLKKPVHREVTIHGEDFIASLEPSLEFTLRKKRHKAAHRQKMETLIDEPPPEVAPDKSEEREVDNLCALHRIKSKIAITPMDLKIKFEVLKAVEALIEDEKYITPQNWD